MNEMIKRIVRVCIQLASIAALIFIDMKLKTYATENLMGKESRVLIPRFLGLSYAENTGSAFSLFSSSAGALTVITAVALAAGIVALVMIKKKPLIYDICLPLIIAGGGGNLLDRITNEDGHVVDYIQTLFMNFPVFNFADCLITCGCIVLIVYLIVEMLLDSKKRKNPQDPYIADREADE